MSSNKINNVSLFVFFIILSLAITIITSIYQRKTGPTYEKNIEVSIHEETYNFKLPRSNELFDASVKLLIPDTTVTAEILWRKYPTNDEYTLQKFARKGDALIAYLPAQGPAGKLQYFVKLHSGIENKNIYSMEDPVFIRFKGHVPNWILTIHILLMFSAMFLSNLTGMLAIIKHNSFKMFTIFTVIFFFFGGMVLGPIVQKYAFGVYWSGVPFGWDLTDNKVLISFGIWFIALIANWKKLRHWIAIIAAVLLMVVYAIPHSTMGSERDPKTGKLGTSEKFMDK